MLLLYLKKSVISDKGTEVKVRLVTKAAESGTELCSGVVAEKGIVKLIN